MPLEFAGGEVDRVVAHRSSGTRCGCPLRIDPAGARVEVIRRKQLLGPERHGGGIGNMTGDVGHAELGRFDLEVMESVVVRAHRIEVEPVENAEADQRRQALAVGGEFVHPIAAEVDTQGRDPFGCVGGQIVERQPSAVFRRGRGDRLGQMAAIERLAA